MRNLRTGLQQRATKYMVFGLVLANCLGIYVANERLNSPYTGPSAGATDSDVDFAASTPAFSPNDVSEPQLSYSANDAVNDLDASPVLPASGMALSSTLPELAALPPVKAEAATFIPSVPATRAARLGRSEARAVRFRAARPQAERGFEATFLPDYAALAPYDGSSEASSLTETAQDTIAPVAGEVRSEAISMDNTAAQTPATEAISEEAVAAPAAQDVAVPVTELPTVDVAVKSDTLPG